LLSEQRTDLQSSHDSHAAAGIGARMTGPGTLLAMLHVVFGALVATGLTDVCADGANGASMITASRHHCRSHRTQLRAVHVQGNAPGHHFDVRFLKT